MKNERCISSSHGLENHGLEPKKDTFWNLSSTDLIEISIRRKEGTLSKDGALVCITGKHTGRSPNDKFIVKDKITEDTIDWGKVNSSITADKFDLLHKKILSHLSSKDLFIQDCYAGADQNNRLKIRVVTESAWHNLFARNMFIQPDIEYLTNFIPDFTVLHAPSCHAEKELHGTNSEVFVLVNFSKKLVIIGGTIYAGEIKKSVFSLLNYILPEKGVLPMHCSANISAEGKSAIFFGLSGTGKTTLSADSNRELIGDDEHGWSEHGVFNFEGGCYAKTIDLDKDKEPDIYKAIRRDALLENVTVNEKGSVDYSDTSITQNTRVSYPIYHIDNIVKPISKGQHASKIIFLTADAFGVLPAVSKLSYEQAEYHFLSGFTAKLAGTERGVTEPQPAFSACYGAAFLMLHPTKYSNVLSKKMKANNSEVFLVNTGWNGKGERISLKNTRLIIDSILNNELDEVDLQNIPIFNLKVPTKVKNIPSELLDPRSTWSSNEAWDKKANELAKLFINNFEKFCDNDHGKKLLASGPQI